MGRFGAMFGVMVVAILIGVAGYQLGVSHGLAIGAQGAAAPDAALAYGWYRPHAFGFFPFFPFLFLAFWFVMLRGLFWGRPGRWRSHRLDWDDPAARFDAWHRRAHERMNTEPPAQNNA